MPQIISLIGPKGSGKSTLAKLLTASDPSFTRMRFAEPLKLMLSAFLEYQGATKSEITAMLDGDKKEQNTFYFDGQTPRLAMQTLGTEWRDLVSKTLWSSALYSKVQVEFSQGKSIIIDDMRFLHEAKLIQALNGITIMIGRDGHNPGTHTSESEYLSIPAELYIWNKEYSPESMLISLNHYLEITCK